MDTPQINTNELVDEEYMHLYKTMHALLHVDPQEDSLYTAEELNIEGV